MKKKDELAIETINTQIQKRIIEYRRESDTRNDTQVVPSYYNSGCCCFSDGDITGIEIADGYMRLVKWCKKEGIPQREVKEESHIEHIAKSIS